MREAQQKNARIYLVSIGIETVAQERIRTAEELGVHRHQIAAAISLLDGGATVPFGCRLGPSVETISGVNRQI